MTPTPEQLYAAARRLNERWEAGAADADDCIVPFENPEATYLEHVCHEMAHAVLLGLEFGPQLSDRVEAAVDRLRTSYGIEASELNETQAFAVVMGVFDVLGVPYDRADMFEANRMQVHYMRESIADVWSNFRCTDAINKIARVLIEETSATSTESSTRSCTASASEATIPSSGESGAST